MPRLSRQEFIPENNRRVFTSTFMYKHFLEQAQANDEQDVQEKELSTEDIHRRNALTVFVESAEDITDTKLRAYQRDLGEKYRKGMLGYRTPGPCYQGDIRPQG